MPALKEPERTDGVCTSASDDQGRMHVRRAKNGISSVHPIRGDEMRALRKLRRDYPKDAYVFVSGAVYLSDFHSELREPQVSIDLPRPVSRTEAAWGDLVEGISKSWMWSAMAMQDIKMRYRGSLLGPFWLTVSMSIMVAAMGLIYARMFNMEINRYLPFLTVGLVIWNFVSTVIVEGCETFLSAHNIITQVRMPFSVHAWRGVYRNLIVLAHNMVIVPLVLLIFSVPVGWNVLIIVPALAILTINGIWVSILLGMISARYRDVPPIVANFVQVLFFVTPVFWPPEALGIWMQALPLNPLFAAIDVVRAPLLGSAPLAYSWTVLLIVTVIGCIGTFLLFVKFRPRIAYWI